MDNSSAGVDWSKEKRQRRGFSLQENKDELISQSNIN